VCEPGRAPQLLSLGASLLGSVNVTYEINFKDDEARIKDNRDLVSDPFQCSIVSLNFSFSH
jgi:hypothetical protein